MNDVMNDMNEWRLDFNGVTVDIFSSVLWDVN